MLRYVYGNDLEAFPKLRDTMFKDRADQFASRLGWQVDVDAQGQERDAYDALNPLYVIWECEDGRHGGSMRFLPSTGRTMINEHFAHIANARIASPFIWECTRFCLARKAGRHVAAALMLGGGEIMQNFDIRHFVGVFDQRMARIYRLIGAAPEILGSAGEGGTRINVGLWHFDSADQARLARRAQLSMAVSRLWFERAFGAKNPSPHATATRPQLAVGSYCGVDGIGGRGTLMTNISRST